MPLTLRSASLTLADLTLNIPMKLKMRNGVPVFNQVVALQPVGVRLPTIASPFNLLTL